MGGLRGDLGSVFGTIFEYKKLISTAKEKTPRRSFRFGVLFFHLPVTAVDFNFNKVNLAKNLSVVY